MMKWHGEIQFIEYRSLADQDKPVVDLLIQEARGDVEAFREMFRKRFKFTPYLCAEHDWEYDLQGPHNLKPINP